MGILDLLRRPTNVNVTVSLPTREQVMGLTAGQLYETQPALRAVVSYLADNVASVPLHLYVRESDSDRRRDTESPAALALRRPNADTTFHELMRDSATDYLLHEWFIWIVLPDADAPSGWSITHIPTEWFDRTPTLDGLHPVSYTFTNPYTNRRVTVPASDCIRFYGYGPRGPLHPSSRINALKQILAEQISAWKYRNGVWRNGGRISAYLTRPKDAGEWSPEARERFAASWKAKFAGDDGTDTGGTPLLEDGMELKTTQFNAREAQWLEVAQLSREEVGGVYHVNPALIWHSNGQTYASAKDNARALYSETMSPFFDMVEERVTGFLLQKLGCDPKCYAEFYLETKLQGSFEERARVLQSATGRPWMVANEARAMNNLPAVEGGDELAIPLNVAIGGLASPNDTDPTVERYNAAPAVATASAAGEPPAAPAAEPARGPLKSNGEAESSDSMATAKCLRKFFKRQSRSVLASIDSAKARGALAKDPGSDFPPWWDDERWNRELADDLAPLFVSQAERRGRRALADIGEDPDGYDAGATEAYLAAMARGKAKAINNVTFRQLAAALDGDAGDEAEGSTPRGVFEKAEDDRADTAGTSIATAVAGWAVLEAVRQRAPNRGAVKTWRTHSANPRSAHAALNGQTVPVGETFSNGAMWPGDQSLTPEESCNCRCSIDITIP